jgi:endonuclease YncB( thermonuclease family)
MFRICSFLILLALPVSAEVISGAARVIDGDTLQIGVTRVRLFGIDAPERAQACEDAAGRRWECGVAARARLLELARAQVRCEARDTDRYGRMVGVCLAGGRDLGAVLVREGLAFAYRRYSQDYVGLEDGARMSRRGLWAGHAERPSEFRAAEHPVQNSPGTCAIKGNISAKGRLYHMPGARSYRATRINTTKGERWFCTESEARAAGWRKAGS